MKSLRSKIKLISMVVTIFMVLMTVPVHSVLAAMIGTETILDMARVQQTRNFLNQFLARADVQKALIVQGVDLQEAQARIDSLTDAELMHIADQIEQLPSGGSDFLGFLLVIALIVFLVLVITDLTGATDVFPFIKSQR
jgi:hypothetical protein